MTAPAKTGVFLGVAAVLLALTLLTAPGSGRTDRFSDEGELFFPEFTAPDQATALEVFEVNEQEVTGRVFKVQMKDGLWTIPSHYDYAADAKDRMAEAAGMLIALRKGAVRSESRADHASLGVVDPRDQEADVEGRGVLVTFRDGDDKVLGELIIGQDVEGRDGFRFVRIPEQRRTYMAKIEAEVSTRFADWVETDLLKLNAFDIERLVFDNYSVDEAEGIVRPGEKLVAVKKDGAWAVEGMDEEKEEVATDKVDDAGRVLGDMKIVGVRPKPPGLDAKLMAPTMEGEMIRRSLVSRGFFLASDGRLYSNEGDLLVTTKEGVVYTLRFGEIVYGSAEEVSAGSEDETERGKEEEGEGNEKKELRPNRYLMVTVDFDLSFFPKPDGEPYPEEEATKRRKAIRDIRDLDIQVAKYKVDKKALPEKIEDALDEETKELAKDPWGNDYVVQALEEDRYRIVTYGADGAEGGEGVNGDINSHELAAEEQRLELGAKFDEWKKKVEAGRDRVKELTRRFAPWYYVIDAESFDKLKLSRKDLVREKEEEGAVEPGDGPGDAPPEEPGDEEEKKDEAGPGDDGGDEPGDAPEKEEKPEDAPEPKKDE